MSDCKQLGIGLAGFGTVGSGVWNTLEKNGELISDRTGNGVSLEITKILVRDLKKVRQTTSEVPKELLTTDWHELVHDPAVYIVVELIGGTTDAFEIVAAALLEKKPVVTGNKALLAEREDSGFADLSQSFSTLVQPDVLNQLEETSTFFQLKVVVRIDTVRITYYSILEREPSRVTPILRTLGTTS